jgi:hypothetical protein
MSDGIKRETERDPESDKGPKARNNFKMKIILKNNTT